MPDVIDIVEILATLMRPQAPEPTLQAKPEITNIRDKIPSGSGHSPDLVHDRPWLESIPDPRDPYTHFLDGLTHPQTQKKQWIGGSRGPGDGATESIPRASPGSDSSGTLLHRVAGEYSEDRLARMMGADHGKSLPSYKATAEVLDRKFLHQISSDRDQGSDSEVEALDDLNNSRRLDRDQKPGGNDEKPQKKKRIKKKKIQEDGHSGGRGRSVSQSQRYKNTPLKAVVNEALGHALPRRSHTASPWVMWTASRAIAQYSADVSPRARRSSAASASKEAPKSVTGARRHKPIIGKGASTSKEPLRTAKGIAPGPESILPTSISNQALAAKLQFIYK